MNPFCRISIRFLLNIGNFVMDLKKENLMKVLKVIYANVQIATFL